MAAGPGSFQGLVDNPGKHDHRFPFYKEGDTQLTCEDCKQVVFIRPEPLLSGPQTVDLMMGRGKPLPWLLIMAARKRPQYVDIAIRYDIWSIGRTRW